MKKPFKFRYVHELVGGFVLATLVLVIVGVFFAGRAQGWFRPVTTYRIRFPAEGSAGIQYGAEVRILGTLVGSVERIAVSGDGAMEAGVSVRGDFSRFVRADSEAVIKRKFAVAGDAFIEITVGSSARMAEEGDYLRCRRDTDLTEILEQIMEQIRAATLPVLEEMRRAVEEYTALGAALNDPDGELRTLLAGLNETVAALNRGEGSLGKLLKDPALAEQAEDLLRQVSTILDETRAILRHLEASSARLPGIVTVVEKEMEAVPGLVDQTYDTLRETEELLAGLQRHWLLRGAMEEDAADLEALPAAAVGAAGKGGAE